MLALPGVVPGSGAIGRVPGGVAARCSRRSRRSGVRTLRAACALRAPSRGSGRCRGVVSRRDGPGGRRCRASVRAGQWHRCRSGLRRGGRSRTCSGPGVPGCLVAERWRRRAAPARTRTGRCAGGRSATGGAGAGRGWVCEPRDSRCLCLRFAELAELSDRSGEPCHSLDDRIGCAGEVHPGVPDALRPK